MKTSSFILACAIAISSTAALAEGGSERVKTYYDNFSLTQDKVHNTTERTAAADAKNSKSQSDEQQRAQAEPSA